MQTAMSRTRAVTRKMSQLAELVMCCPSPITAFSDELLHRRIKMLLTYVPYMLEKRVGWLTRRQELTLLSDDLTFDEVIEEHEMQTAPLFTREAFLQAGLSDEHSQYGVLGRVIAIQCVHHPCDDHIVLDISFPQPTFRTTEASRSSSLRQYGALLFDERGIDRSIECVSVECPVLSLGVRCPRLREVAHSLCDARKYVLLGLLQHWLL